MAVAYAGAAVSNGRLWIVGGESSGQQPIAAVQMVVPNRGFGSAGDPGAGSPFAGDKLLIADRGSDRLLLLDDRDRVVWRYPSPGRRGATRRLLLPRRRLLHPPRDGDHLQPGGQRHDRRDRLSVGADHLQVRPPAQSGNCRRVPEHPRRHVRARQRPDERRRRRELPGAHHRPAHEARRRTRSARLAAACTIRRPRSARRTATRRSRTATCSSRRSTAAGSTSSRPRDGRSGPRTSPIGYPSDPQQIGPDRYLVADYEHPGGIVEFDRRGRILYRYQPTSGSGVLDHPSLVERLPSGVFMVNDDYNDRMVAIDPSTRALVWQYGAHRHAGHRSRASQHPGRLRPARAGRQHAHASDDRMKPRATMTPRCAFW